MSSPANDHIPVQTQTRTQQAALLSVLRVWADLRLIENGQIQVHSLSRTDPLQLDIILPVGDRSLSGLETWLQLGLLSQAEVSIKLKLQSQHPALLSGLEAWLQNRLPDDSDLLHRCKPYLTCELPTAPLPSAAVEPDAIAAALPASPPTEPAQKPNRWRQMMQFLVAELSVFWLLLLGTFMVVVSSGVLAASQWERFPAFAQYGILWLYTLGFWGSSLWAVRQPSLQLTTQALRLITLLLVPLNVLVLDSFGQWRSPLQWLVAAIATVSLTGLTRQVFQSRDSEASMASRPGRSRLSRMATPAALYLGLSALHLGWGLRYVPLVTTYGGVVGTAFLNRYSRPHPAPDGDLDPERPAPFNPAGILTIYAVGLLLLRALLAAQLPLSWFGLALGLSGWCLLERSPAIGQTSQVIPQTLWQRLGWAALLLGWLISVISLPWQAFLVSGLASLVLARHMLRTWSQNALLILLIVGLQMLLQAWRTIPFPTRSVALAIATRLTGAETMPVALLGVALLPYVGALVVLSDWLIQRRQRQLARFAAALAIAVGGFLAILAGPVPTLRAITVGGLTLLLGWFTWRQFQRDQYRRHHYRSYSGSRRSRFTRSVQWLAALTHLGGLTTLCLTMAALQPRLGLVPWAAIGLGLTVWEWGLNLGPNSGQSLEPNLEPNPGQAPEPEGALPSTFPALLRQRAWHFGLLLSGLAYGVLRVNLTQQGLGSLWGHPLGSPVWGGLWLVVPLMLTGVVTRQPQRRLRAAELSMGALCLAQGLTVQVPGLWLLSLAIATGLMLVNTSYLQRRLPAALAVGFGLAFIGASIGQLLPQITPGTGLVLGAIASLSLWLLRHGLTRWDTPLARLYRQACDGWAIAFCSLDLLLLSGVGQNFELGTAPVPAALSAALLLMGGAAYRSWQTRQPKALWLSILVLVLAQMSFWGGSFSLWIVLAASLALMVIQTRLLRHRGAAAVTLGLGLEALGLLLWRGVGAWRVASHGGWLLAWAIAAVGLVLVWRGLLRRAGTAHAYCRAAEGWALALGTLTLVGLTLDSLLVYLNLLGPSPPAVSAAGLMLGATAYLTWKAPSNKTLWTLGWSLELLTLEVLGLTGQSLVALAIANTALGLVTQLLGDWWHRRTQQSAMLSGWHALPLVYAGLGSLLRWNLLESWTGLSTLGLVLVALGVGRRRAAFTPLLYLAIAGISLSAYELLLGQIQGLEVGDQLLAMAALSATILYAYRLLAPWLTGYLRLPPSDLVKVSHCHWALGSLLLAAAPFYPVALNKLVGLGAGIFLTRYAIMQGRYPSRQRVGEIWVCLGLLEAAAIALYVGLTLPVLGGLAQLTQPWIGAFASLLAAGVYLLPWRQWGWSPRTWRWTAVLAPLFVILPNLLRGAGGPNLISLVMIGVFYGWLARQRQQPRWLYVSLLLLAWGIWQFLAPQDGVFAQVCLMGLSVFSITGFEPACRSESGRVLSHRLRCLGLGVMGLFALGLYAEPGIVPGVLGLVGIFIGLSLRIRAFLYVGTATFLAIVFYQMALLVSVYPMLKWAIGLLVGLGLIWVAASFETRRRQFAAALHAYLATLEDWA
ncbi:MAG: hypothetical protein ACFB4J_07645 [Elainellaceae cyanobacterium]